MMKPVATLLGIAFSLVISASSEAFKRPPDDGRQNLTPPAAERDLGQPVAIDAKTLAAIRAVHTEPGELPQLQVAVDGKKLDLPLKHTQVKAELTGHVARVEVTQSYQNPFAHPIEALYIFPLPENSAVDDMRMVIGERVIQAEIKKRQEARDTYEQAKREGHTAALLEQERPNIFTQSVANIEPGTDIDVVVRYVQDLTYDAGEYEFVFPMVVGPRFIPGADAGSRTGPGWGRDTDQVPDGSRITPPVVGGGMRSGHDIGIDIVATAGLPIATWEVPTHEVQYLPTLDGSLALTLSPKDTLPNRDFVLRYRVDGKEPQATVLSHKDGEEGYLTLIVQPPSLDIDTVVGMRELIFVIDISGSMSGVPLAMCQDAMEQAIRNMRPVDTFNVITFAGATGKAFASPRPASDTNIKAALTFVRDMQAGGGTYMLDGIKAALGNDVERGRHRYVFFLTDGYVGNENEILSATAAMVKSIEAQGQRAKVFGMGVGSSVNRMLIDGLGKAGKGAGVYATTREDPAVAVNTFYRFIDRAIIEDVSIDWGGLKVEQVFPTHLPDLFASRPLLLHAKYAGSGTGTITVRGTAQGRKLELPIQVTLPQQEKGHAALATLWARAKIDDLSRDLWRGEARQAMEAITELGLRYRLVTAYTSFVAVDRSKKVTGQSQTILQPVETPEGVDADMAGAERLTSGKGRLAAAPMTKRTYVAGGRKDAEAQGLGTGARGGNAVTRGRSVEVTPVATMEPRALPEAPKAASNTEAKTPAKGDKLRQQALTPEQWAVVKSNQKATEACYTAAAKSLPGLTGRVVLRFFITDRGVVLQLVVQENTTGSAELGQCLAKAVRTWNFPMHTGGSVQVLVPFVFPLSN